MKERMKSEILFLAAFGTDEQPSVQAARSLSMARRLAVQIKCGCGASVGLGHDGTANGLCEGCFLDGGWENDHNDGHHEPGDEPVNCPVCRTLV